MYTPWGSFCLALGIVCCCCCGLLIIILVISFVFTGVIHSNTGAPTPVPTGIPTPAPTPTFNNTFSSPPTPVPTPAPTFVPFPTPPPPVTPNTTLSPTPANVYTTVPSGIATCQTASNCTENLQHVAVANCTDDICHIVECEPFFHNCNNLTIDGCESNSLTDPNNCFTCGNQCWYTNAYGNCTLGFCRLGPCSYGYANCDSSTTGCYTNVMSDPNNCGGCNSKCSIPNAIPGCTNETCTIASCSIYYANCDNNTANGCESFTPTSNLDCGGCQIPCTVPNTACASSNCYYLPGFSPGANCTSPGPCPACMSGTTNSSNICTLSNNGLYCQVQVDCASSLSQCSRFGVCGGSN